MTIFVACFLILAVYDNYGADNNNDFVLANTCKFLYYFIVISTILSMIVNVCEIVYVKKYGKTWMDCIQSMGQV